MAQQKKARRVGRPKLPKGEAKGETVQARFAPDDIKAIEVAAKDSGQTKSEWVRSAIRAVLRSNQLIAQSDSLMDQSNELLARRLRRQSESQTK